MATQSVIIEGNAVDDINGGGAGYYYDDLMSVNAQAKIDGNQLNASPSNNLLNITNTCVVSNNYFNPKSGIGNKHIYATAACRIMDNTFASSAVQYGIDISANATISGNVFERALAGTTFINMTNCQCTVHDNKFTRGAVSIPYYIKINGSSGHQITDNVFDNTTVDGTTESLIGTPAAVDNVSRNKNQIAYMSTMASDHTNGGLHQVSFTATKSVNTFQYNNLATITSTGGIGATNYVSFHFVNISRILPPKARLLGILVGMKWNVFGNAITGNGMSFTMNLYKTDTTLPIGNPNTNIFNTPASTLASKAASGDTVLSDTVPFAPQTASVPSGDNTVKYLSADYTSSNLYNDGVNDLVLRLLANYQINNNNGTGTYNVSPILIRYTY